MCEGVFIIHNSHFWAQNNPHIHRHECQVCFSISVCAGVNGDIVVGPCLLPDGLTAQQYHDFLAAVLLGLLEVVPLGVRQKKMDANLEEMKAGQEHLKEEMLAEMETNQGRIDAMSDAHHERIRMDS
jgi:hypothetical protein